MRSVGGRVRISSLIAVAAMAVVVAGCAGDTDDPGNGGTSEAGGSVGTLLEETSADGHQLREVPADTAPSVRMEVSEDPDSGWNVHLGTERFAFAPERVGGEVRAGEGHAHLYLDGGKIARLYGSWHHLPGDAVSAGVRTLTVQLNANDHTVWATDGVPVSAEAEITSIGDDGDHDHGQSDTPSNPPATDEAKVDVSVDIEISGGEVAPAPGRTSVGLGETVRIEVTSDQPDTVHVHGYDVEADVSPSTPVVLEFTADQSGLFEVETHDSGLLLTQLLVE